jgi:hypothetical protein
MTKIPLIVYGDNPAEYGNPNADLTDDMNMEWFSCKDQNEIYISGYPIKKLKKDLDLTNAQLEPYVPVTEKEFKNQKLKYVSLSYFTNWHPQHNYYYTIENSNNFQTSGERNCGTYTTNSGLDDKIDDLHYYTTFIKFGLGRVHYDAAQEIRSGDITIEEGKELIKKYNGEFPDRWFDDISKYLTINPNKFPKIQNFFTEYNFNKDYFMSICDKFRSPHLWKKENNIYKKNFNI